VIVAPVVHPLDDAALQLPKARLVQQRFALPAAIDVTAQVESEWQRVAARLGLRPGARIAVAVGSRGIDGLLAVVKAVVAHLRAAGCEPFIVPAMGSHGGASAQGQAAVLANAGITAASVGVPIRATMDVVSLGVVDGISLYLDREASEADGIVVINRLKPHTDFAGPMGSGLLKMLCIGLGNQTGADHLHRAGVARDLGVVVRLAGGALLQRAHVLFGVAIIENQEHRACDVRLLPADEMVAGELALQATARTLLPGLPLDDIDLLIVDEMGKDISGAGLDPNVIGRSLGSWQVKRTTPRIARIFVRDLTPASEGNACGLGFVDVATPRLLEKVDPAVTAVNAVTACFPEDMRLPLTVATEREAIAVALATIRPYTLDDLRLVHIKNTLAVERLVVSQGCLAALEARDDVIIDAAVHQLGFDEHGEFVSPLAGDGAA
jgi:hypothetical protein